MIRAIAFLVGFCCPARKWPTLYCGIFANQLVVQVSSVLGGVFVQKATGEDLDLIATLNGMSRDEVQGLINREEQGA